RLPPGRRALLRGRAVPAACARRERRLDLRAHAGVGSRRRRAVAQRGRRQGGPLRRLAVPGRRMGAKGPDRGGEPRGGGSDGGAAQQDLNRRGTPSTALRPKRGTVPISRKRFGKKRDCPSFFRQPAVTARSQATP